MSTLALIHLFDSAKALMDADAAAQLPPVSPVPQLFGWRESAQKMVTGPRIAWIPGDPSGRLGVVNPPRNPGRNPRSLGTLEELCTVEITCEDATGHQDERKQYIAARQLYDAWFRAVYLVAHGAFRFVDSGWVTDRKELRRGAALRVVIAVQAVLADEPLEVAPTTTGARIATALVDTVEATTVETATTAPAVTDPGGDVVIDEDGNIVTQEAP